MKNRSDARQRPALREAEIMPWRRTPRARILPDETGTVVYSPQARSFCLTGLEIVHSERWHVELWLGETCLNVSTCLNVVRSAMRWDRFVPGIVLNLARHEDDPIAEFCKHVATAWCLVGQDLVIKAFYLGPKPHGEVFKTKIFGVHEKDRIDDWFARLPKQVP